MELQSLSHSVHPKMGIPQKTTVQQPDWAHSQRVALRYAPIQAAHFASAKVQLRQVEFGHQTYQDAWIPTVNLAEFTKGDAANRKAFAEKLGHAFQQYGFIGVQGYDIPESDLDNVYQLMEKTFDLPVAVKEKYAHKEISYQRGYTPLGAEKKGKTLAEQLAGQKSRKELKENWHWGRYDNISPSESEIPGFKAASERLHRQMEDVGIQILKALDLYLNTKTSDGRGYFESLVLDPQGHKIGWHLTRQINYPPVDIQYLPQDEQQSYQDGDMIVRGGAHADMNFMTLLPRSTAAGLQVLSPGVKPEEARESDWLNVKVPPKTIIVNAADMLFGLLENTEFAIPPAYHRVVGREERRMSCVTFIHPNHYAEAKHVKTGNPLFVQGKNGKAPCKTFGDFIFHRLHADFGTGSTEGDQSLAFTDKNAPFNLTSEQAEQLKAETKCSTH
jgi:isopenicillin N synthase-like dioxygenase